MEKTLALNNTVVYPGSYNCSLLPATCPVNQGRPRMAIMIAKPLLSLWSNCMVLVRERHGWWRVCNLMSRDLDGSMDPWKVLLSGRWRVCSFHRVFFGPRTMVSFLLLIKDWKSKLSWTTVCSVASLWSASWKIRVLNKWYLPQYTRKYWCWWTTFIIGTFEWQGVSNVFYVIHCLMRTWYIWWVTGDLKNGCKLKLSTLKTQVETLAVKFCKAKG